MKKVVFGFIALGFISLSSFTTIDSKEIVAHTCIYAMFNSNKDYIGRVVLHDVPDNISCSSAQAKQAAIDYWNSLLPQ